MLLHFMPCADRCHIQVERADFFGCSSPGRRICDRPDVLSFSTPPLECDVEVTGTGLLTLYFSSTAPDTDFCATQVLCSTAHIPGEGGWGGADSSVFQSLRGRGEGARAGVQVMHALAAL